LEKDRQCGIAVDPYIQNATFFWDKDKDGIRDSDEPISSASDESETYVKCCV